MAGGRIDRLRMARGRSVTAAIVGRAQMRDAFQDFARNLDAWLAGIVAFGFGVRRESFPECRHAFGASAVREFL